MGITYPALGIQGLDLAAIDEARSKNELQKLALAQANEKIDANNKLKELIATLPPEQRLLASLDRDEYAKQMMKRQFPDPKDRYMPVGSSLFDVSGATPKRVAGGLTLEDGSTIGNGASNPLMDAAKPYLGGGSPPAAAKPAEIPPVFRDAISSHAERTGLDPQLLGRMVGAESGFNPSATSSAGAQGLTQLMPGTAKDPGFGVTPAKDGTWDENLRVGADYLKAMKDRYGDTAVALAAYNWGPGAVDGWLAAGADPRKLPGETQAYIAKITGRPFTGLAQAAQAGGTATDGGGDGNGAAGVRYFMDENGKPVSAGDGLFLAMNAQGQRVAVPMRGSGVTQLSPQEVAGLGLPPGTVAQRAANGQVSILSKPETLTPEQEAQKIRLAQAGRPSVNVQVSGDKKGAEKLYTDAAESFTTAQNAGRQASRNGLLYDQFEQALEGFKPGAGADTRLKAGQILQGMGINAVAGVPEGELAKSVGAQLELAAAASMRGQGQITENERAILRAGIPALTTTLEGNRKIIGLMRRLDSYDMQVAQVYRDNARANGGIVDPVSVAEEVAKLGAPLSNADLSWLQKGGRRAVADLPPMDQRKIGSVYQTPRGPAKWMGNGWELQGN